MRRHWPLRILKIAVVAALALGVVGFAIMSLWNWLAPAMFGGHAIGFWQALGVFVLARLLVGGLRRGGGGRGHWRQRLQARWHDMSDEERAQFRERFGRRCGPRRDAAGGQPA